MGRITYKHSTCWIGGAEMLGNGNEAYFLFVEELYHLHEIQQGARQSVYFVHYDDVNLTGIDISQQQLESQTIHVTSGKTAIIISIWNGFPALKLLALDVGLTSFSLGIE